MRSKTKRLQNKAILLAREYCLERDGYRCQVQKNFPIIALRHSEVLQLDHCFSRSIKELFLDAANLTIICSVCNQAKGSGKISASKKDAVTVAVHEIVKKREGMDTYNRLLEIASRKCAFKDWNNIKWLTIQIGILESMIEGIEK